MKCAKRFAEALILLVLLVAAGTSAGAGTVGASPALLDLPRVALRAADLNGVCGVEIMQGESEKFSVADAMGSGAGNNKPGIIDRIVHRADENSRQGWDTYFTSDGSQLRMRIRLIEFENASYARDLKIKSNAPIPQGFPAGSSLQNDTNGGFASAAANTNRGRVLVITVVNYFGGAPIPFPMMNCLVSEMATLQSARIPPTEDLNSSSVFDGASDKNLLGIALVLSIPLIALLYLFAVTVRDVAAREWLRTRRSQVPRTPGLVQDLSGRVRVNRLRSVVFNTFQVAVACAGVALMWFATPGLSLYLSVAMLACFIGAFAFARLIVGTRDVEKFAPRSRLVVAGLVGTIGSSVVLAGAVMMLVAITAAATFYFSLVLLIPILGMFGLMLALLEKVAWPYRMAKRIAAPGVAEVLQADSRREILLLRSFQDDDLEIRMRKGTRHSSLEMVATEPYERFEELVAWSLWSHGPVVAIGQPGTVVPPLGAAREYYSDDDWQAAIKRRIQASFMVVFIVGRSPSLQWEAGTVRAEGALGRALFLLPPENYDEVNKRLRVLASALDLDPACLPVQSDSYQRTIGLIFNEQGFPVLLTAPTRDDLAFRAAIEFAANTIHESNGVRLCDPATAVCVWRQPIDPLLTTFDPDRRRAPSRLKLSSLFGM